MISKGEKVAIGKKSLIEYLETTEESFLWEVRKEGMLSRNIKAKRTRTPKR